MARRKASPWWLALPLVLAGACGTQGSATSTKSPASRIILTTRVVSIPSDGRIVTVLGSSWKLDKRKNAFVALHPGSLLVSDDLLLLKKDSRITIEFEDGSRVTVDPKDYPAEGAGGDFSFTLEKMKR